MNQRPRRNRKSNSVRNLIEDIHLSAKDFVWPLFIIEGENQKQEIPSMPKCYRYSIDLALKEAEELFKKGLCAVALFPSLPDELKNKIASESANANGLLQRAIKSFKNHLPDICVISDVAMDPYSSDGHDGLVKSNKILNDESLPILSKMALSQAESGSDYVAPSDMMDGRIKYIRKTLDENGYTDVGIISYSVKYASYLYDPFREALDSAPKGEDKRTYQMNFANSNNEALREVNLDIQEGADIIMIKPALYYLDIIHSIKQNCHIPIAAYNVSGEYAMIKAAVEKGWLSDEKEIVIESLVSIKRAGANMIFSYWTPQVLDWLKN